MTKTNKLALVPVMLCFFCMGFVELVGIIGNTLMKTSLNPLVSSIIKGNLAAALTFGQFVKAIATFMPHTLPCGEPQLPFRNLDSAGVYFSHLHVCRHHCHPVALFHTY